MILTKRLVKASPLTAQEGDANWTKIEQAINDLMLAFSSSVDGITLTIDGGVIKIKALGVDTDQLAALAVTAAKLAEDAVTEDKILDGAVTINKIDNDAVITLKIADGAVTSGKIENGAVTSDKIFTGAVTSEKIQDEGVTIPKLAYATLSTSGDTVASWADAPTFNHTLIGSDDITFSDEIDGQSIAIAVTNPTGIEQTVTFLVSSGDLIWNDGGATTAIASGKTVVFTFIKVGDAIFGGAKGPYTLP